MRIFKSTWTKEQNTKGIYLVLPGSNSVWCGFKSKKEAEICMQVLLGWKVLIHK